MLRSGRSNHVSTALRWLLPALAIAFVGGVVLSSCSSDDGKGSDGDVNPRDLSMNPRDQNIEVDPAEDPTPIDFSVTVAGAPVDADWSVDRPDLAEVDDEGNFVATGRGAGVVTVTATVGDASISTTVNITIATVQNGPDESSPGGGGGEGTPADFETGPGGFMGIGGEGIGGPVSDEIADVLQGDTTSDSSLRILYPYDGTVWPLGMLAPLIMWEANDAESIDGVSIELTAEDFAYRGMFARPAALGGGDPFVRHPIPLDVWQMATTSAAGGELELRLTVSRDGQAYGPIKETWKVAQGNLEGCVYYQSYFTELVDNEDGALGPDSRFGAATLGLRPGGTDPVLVAGWTSDHKEGCRVCHSVSADGSRMVVQHGDKYDASSSIDLQNNYEETEYPADTDGTLGWVGMTPDGELGVGNSAEVPGGASEGPTALYDMETGEPIESTGLTDFVTHAGLPAFAHDGSMLAFNFWEGPGNDEIGGGNERKLVVMDFDREASHFSNPRLMWEGDYRPGWASFFPNNAGLVFQIELENGSGDHVMNTRSGGEGELWWAHIESGEAARLDRANGRDGDDLYIPTSSEHPDDSIVNFEPTVAPISSGGYAWIVFMSRRLYGNVITAEPWASDPRSHDLTEEYSPKKLWIAAIDLNAEPGTDPSYPAIYLPAQEIQASNSRGFWTSDPCVYTGQM